MRASYSRSRGLQQLKAFQNQSQLPNRQNIQPQQPIQEAVDNNLIGLIETLYKKDLERIKLDDEINKLVSKLKLQYPTMDKYIEASDFIIATLKKIVKIKKIDHRKNNYNTQKQRKARETYIKWGKTFFQDSWIGNRKQSFNESIYRNNLLEVLYHNIYSFKNNSNNTNDSI